jgi:hypothetical protein
LDAEWVVGSGNAIQDTHRDDVDERAAALGLADRSEGLRHRDEPQVWVSSSARTSLSDALVR